MSQNNLISIKILGRSYKIKCPPDKVPGLQAAAEYVDEKMCVLRQQVKAASLDHLAVVAALNISHELLQTKQQQYCDGNTIIKQRIQKLQRHIDQSLSEIYGSEIS